MKLFGSPGACSLGIHVILEEIGQPYDFAVVNVREGQQFTPEFLAVNPKAKVPALQREDGSVLTEFTAIAFWLARNAPEAGLIAPEAEGQARALELIDYVVASVHMRGFTLMMMPQKFVSDEAAQGELREVGRKAFASGLEQLSQDLGGKDWFLGDYSIADAAVFYVVFWAVNRAQMPLADNLRGFYDRMIARPAVLAALRQEGLA